MAVRITNYIVNYLLNFVVRIDTDILPNPKRLVSSLRDVIIVIVV